MKACYMHSLLYFIILMIVINFILFKSIRKCLVYQVIIAFTHFI